MVGFIRTRRWEIRLSRKTIKIIQIIFVKEKYQDKAKQIFQGSKITITTERHRHLGLVTEGKTFKESYIKELVSKWCGEL